jgi:hypothetical protein
MRADYIHQILLSGKSSMLKQRVVEKQQKTEEFLTANESLIPASKKLTVAFVHMLTLFRDEIVARFYVESGMIWHLYMNNVKSKECLEKAKQSTGLVYNLTGKMGVRTKFQTVKTPQLVLEAQSKTDSPQLATGVPKDLLLEDETLLNKPSLDGTTQTANLLPIDQVILLGVW